MTEPTESTDHAARVAQREIACDATLSGPLLAAESLVRVLDEYVEARKRGEAPRRQEWLDRYPELAPQLESYLAALEFLQEGTADVDGTSGRASAGSAAAGRRLGDFRILREVGRGGMGAVFEAEQISLGRRVALKVLRFGGVSDDEAIERFQREAETVAKLHHTHIVPIFAVGNEGGVNYYAMQFIEGRSLAEVLSSADGPIDAGQVATWGLQAAEALAHAHQRGVVHRDVKPSNLLLDGDDCVWLTDFGLARRFDDVTLSMTGAILGTPRYMSPEQATASTKRVDHRSDLFSLGATLYELLVARPAFAGDTPHQLIAQIVHCDPVPIRKLNPAVPRDLETVVMKCLSKEPNARYATAIDLASDLRACIEGRSIAARRANRVELVTRWVKRNRHGLRQSGIAVAATAAVLAAAMIGIIGYQSWNRSAIRLDAANPPLVAEIVDRSGDAVLIGTLPMTQPATLPAGDYRVTVSGNRQWSDTFDMLLLRGHLQTEHGVNLQDRLIMPPQAIERSYEVVDLGVERGIVEWTDRGVRLQTKRLPTAWHVELSSTGAAALAESPGFVWPWRPSQWAEASGFATDALQPWVMGDKVDVDGDGTGDIIFAARHQAWLLAMSGRTGEVLWFAGRDDALADAVAAEGNSDPTRRNLVTASVVDRPFFIEDLDRDGIADMVVSMIAIDPDAAVKQERYSARRWVEAISGKTGQTIWRYDLPGDFFELSAGEEVPYRFRWYPDPNSGYSRSGDAVYRSGTRHVIREASAFKRNGPHVYLADRPQAVTLAGERRLAIVAGDHLILVDPDDGTAAEQPIDLAIRVGAPTQWAAIPGDQSPCLVTLIERPLPAAPPVTLSTVGVWSYTKQKMIWTRQLGALMPRPASFSSSPAGWPLVVDLDGDGHSEIVVPDDSWSKRGATAGATIGFMSGEIPWGELAVLGGEDGRPRWKSKLVTMDGQVDHFIDGPDLDGDGTREIFVATLNGHHTRLHVDALSGTSGATLWTANRQLDSREETFTRHTLNPLRWWRSSVDGWPQLLLNVAFERSESGTASFHTISAGTGEWTHRGAGYATAQTVDLDHDGLEELLLYASRLTSQIDRGGELQCVRGIGGQSWKRLDHVGEPVADLNGDGIDDLVQSWGDGTLDAVDGGTGKRLWQSRPIRSTDALGIVSAASKSRSRHEKSSPESPVDGDAGSDVDGDLNGDGFVDLLVHERSAGGRGRVRPLHAVSGKDGRLIWSLSDVKVRMIGGTLALQSRDLDGDGDPEVIWLAAVDHEYPDDSPFSTHANQLWLFVASGRSGRLKSATPLSPAYGKTQNDSRFAQFHFAKVDLAFADLDQDNTLDILVPGLDEDGGIAIHAISGKTAETLWKRAVVPGGAQQTSLDGWVSPTVVDFDGGGKSTVIVIEPDTAATSATPSAKPLANVVALDGVTGQPLWTRPTTADFAAWGSRQANHRRSFAPMPVRGDDHRNRVAVVVPWPKARVILFDASGESVGHDVALAPDSPRPMAIDVDGDDIDEMVLLDDAGVSVLSLGSEIKPVWNHPTGPGVHREILEILKRPDASPILALRGDATDNSVIGLDSASGIPVWICPGPVPRSNDGIYLVPSRVSLLGGRGGEMPRIFYAHGSVAESRQSVRIGNIGWETLAARGAAVHPPRVSGVKSDPRWKRDLPWHGNEMKVSAAGLAFLAWCVYFSLSLVLIPGFLLVRLVTNRRFGLQTLLAVPVVAALAITATLVQSPPYHEFQTTGNRMAIGVMTGPPLIALTVLVAWTIRRRWLRLASVALAVVLATVICGLASFALRDGGVRSLLHESYEWSGWYEILLPGVYMTSWLLVSGVALRWLFQRVIKRIGWGKRSERTAKPLVIR